MQMGRMRVHLASACMLMHSIGLNPSEKKREETENMQYILVMFDKSFEFWVGVRGKFLSPLLLSVGHLCDIQGLFSESTVCAQWIALNCN